MTESKKIICALNEHGKDAYEQAKRDGRAVVMRGNDILLVKADGKEQQIRKVSNSYVSYVGRKKTISLRRKR